MNGAAVDKKTKFLLIGLLLVAVVLVVLAISLLVQTQPPSNKETGQQPSQAGFFSTIFSSSLEVVSLLPQKDTLFPPGGSGSFSLTFNKPLRLDALTITVSRHSFPTDETQLVKTSLSQGNSDKTVVVQIAEALKPYSTYTITVFENNPKQKLIERLYATANPEPTPIQTNNPALAQFLPYETNTYALSFLADRNLYVFNFIYNPDDPTDIQTQFETAKQNANLYIKSRGVDPNSVVIDWRFH